MYFIQYLVRFRRVENLKLSNLIVLKAHSNAAIELLLISHRCFRLFAFACILLHIMVRIVDCIQLNLGMIKGAKSHSFVKYMLFTSITVIPLIPTCHLFDEFWHKIRFIRQALLHVGRQERVLNILPFSLRFSNLLFLNWIVILNQDLIRRRTQIDIDYLYFL